VAKSFPAKRIPGDAVEKDGGFCVGECALLPQILPGTWVWN